jgi:hypothetical protein
LLTGGCPTLCQLFYGSILWSSIKESLPKHLGGCPSKLTTSGQYDLAQEVTSGAADTAPELMRLLDLNITFQTVRNSLKKAGPKSAVNVEMPMLSRACGGDGWNLLWSTTTGLWRTGAVLFGHMGLI